MVKILISLLIPGSPVAGDASEDYQNDYYADEEYYSDDYDASVETNEIFDASGNRETVVKRNPKFITPQKNLMVNEGETIKLPCVVDQLDQNFAIIWKKSEKHYPSLENYRKTFQTIRKRMELS